MLCYVKLYWLIFDYITPYVIIVGYVWDIMLLCKSVH